MTLRTTKEAAEYCGYKSTRSFIRMRNAGKGPAYIRTPGKVLYRESDLDAWLDAHRIEPVRGVSV